MTVVFFSAVDGQKHQHGFSRYILLNDHPDPVQEDHGVLPKSHGDETLGIVFLQHLPGLQDLLTDPGRLLQGGVAASQVDLLVEIELRLPGLLAGGFLK